MRATRQLARFLTPYRNWALLAPLLMLLEVSMDLLQPRLIARIIDQGLGRGDLPLIYSTAAWMLGCAVVGLLGGMGCTVFAVRAAQNFGADLRGNLFRQVQTLSFGNLDRLETGKLITRLTGDVTQVQEMVMMLLRVMVRTPLLLVGSVLMAALTSPRLALLFVVLLPLVTLILRWIINRTYPLFSQVQSRLDTLNTVMQENLAGVRVVKAFSRSDHELGRFRRANDGLTDRNIAATRTGAATMPLMMLTLNFGLVAAIWLGGRQVLVGGLQTGQLIAFINYLGQALMSLMSVSMLTSRLSRAEASAERINEVLRGVPDITPAAAPVALPTPRGRVAFEQVTFGYGHSPDPALRDVSFVAEPGETIAILGATGAGKSTLLNLIPRFYDVTGGRITLDGVDIRDLDEATLRETVGIALQEAVLFSGTLRDTIRYGQPDADAPTTQAAAEIAQAHEFIARLPERYDAPIGQRGVNLSGGQKQRLAIARAVLPRPAVLLLDDSTSAVDVATEARIQAALAEGSRDQTRLIVAQRISTVLAADRILILAEGRLAASGTHDELLATSPLYREIYESQMEHGAVVHDAV